MKKKQVCIILAGLVSGCCLVCLLASIVNVIVAVRTNNPIPMGTIMLTLVTGLCAGVIWKGVREIGE